MSDLHLIKEEIFNLGLIAQLLESMGCDINTSTSSSERVEASRPGGNNNRSVQVYLNEHLPSRVRSKAHVPVQDIYDLVSYIQFGKETAEELKRSLPQAKKYIIETLGLSQFSSGSTVIQDDPNAWLKDIQRKRKQRINLEEIEPNPVLPEEVMDEFILAPHELWVEDSISPYTQEFFEVGYDLATERIVFPVRDVQGSIVGIKGRATREQDMKNYKYMPIYAFQKSKILYNLNYALTYIQEKNEIILVEAEKSVMKLWEMNHRNIVSQMGSDLTKIQAEIIKRISPDLRIVLAFDKDKTPNEVKQMAQVFGKYDNLYGIIDVKGYLSDTDSPCDKGLDVFNELLNNHCYKIFP